MKPNKTNSTIAALLADEQLIAEQLQAIAGRIEPLRQRLHQVEGRAAEQRAAAQRARAAAVESLQVALLAGDEEAAAAARAEAARPMGGDRHEAEALSIEAQAVQKAIAELEGERSRLQERSADLAQRVRAATLVRLDLEGESLPVLARAKLADLMGVYVKAIVMSEMAEAAGAPPGRYGPSQLPPMQTLYVGKDRGRTGSPLYISVSTGDVIDQVRDVLVDKLRSEGFRV